jgi:hypothetical protein
MNTEREELLEGATRAEFHYIGIKLPVIQGWLVEDEDYTEFTWFDSDGVPDSYHIKTLTAGCGKQYICTGFSAVPIGYAVPKEWEE